VIGRKNVAFGSIKSLTALNSLNWPVGILRAGTNANERLFG